MSTTYNQGPLPWYAIHPISYNINYAYVNSTPSWTHDALHAVKSHELLAAIKAAGARPLWLTAQIRRSIRGGMTLVSLRIGVT